MWSLYVFLFFFTEDGKEEFIYFPFYGLSFLDYINLVLNMCWAFSWGFVSSPMLSVDTACAYAFSLGSEGLNIRPLRVMLSLVALHVFSLVDFKVGWQSNRHCYSKVPSELPSYGLMIVWVVTLNLSLVGEQKLHMSGYHDNIHILSLWYLE